MQTPTRINSAETITDLSLVSQSASFPLPSENANERRYADGVYELPAQGCARQRPTLGIDEKGFAP